jgi:hypothetical protein
MSGYPGTLLSHHGLLGLENKFVSKPFTKHGLLDQVDAVIRDLGQSTDSD